MATTISKYLDKCYEVYQAKPTYVKNQSNLRECDCIGMDKYSFRENNVAFSTTGTNYSFRKQVENIRAIKSESDLNVGDVVFKAYEPGESGWKLPDKYQQGGSEYNGDLNDYYHIGTVRSVNPLQIIHMTTPTAKMDTTLNKKGWDFAANWKKEYISDSPSPEPPGPTPPTPPTPPSPYPYDAVVTKDKVNTRKGPDENYGQAKVGKLNAGDIVQVDDTTINDEGEDWSKCEYTDKKGAHWTNFWVKSCFLEPVDTPEPEPEPEPEPGEDLWTVMIPGLTAAQADALIAQYPDAQKYPDDGAVG